MSKTITARFNDVDSAERAATALKHSLLSQHIEKLSISAPSSKQYTEVPPIPIPFGMSGTTPYYSGTQNNMTMPFSSQYGIFLSRTSSDLPSSEHSEEALLRLICSNNSSGKFHGKLIALGAYEIHIS